MSESAVLELFGGGGGTRRVADVCDFFFRIRLSSSTRTMLMSIIRADLAKHKDKWLGLNGESFSSFTLLSRKPRRDLTSFSLDFPRSQIPTPPLLPHHAHILLPPLHPRG